MDKISPKNRNYGILLLTLVIAIAGVGGTINLVSADPCIAQLSYPVMPTSYNYNSNIQVIVPVSATCAAVSGQLYAVGDAYDTSVNTDIGSTSTLLTLVSGDTFSGQLVYNLAPSSVGHNVQVSVSIYSGQYSNYAQNGSLLTSASETVQVTPANYQNAPIQSGYPVQQPPSYNIFPNFPFLFHQQQTTVTAYVPQQVFPQQPFPRAQFLNRQNNNWLMALVVVLIVISVIVAVAFALIATRNRQPQHQPWPPPPDQNRRQY